MRIGIGIDGDRGVDEMVRQTEQLAAAGCRSVWVNQIFGWDALTALAVIGTQVPDVTLGTAVVPVQPRHPVVLAGQALTVQSATGNRLKLGIGLSHQVVVETVFGGRWERQVDFLEQYLEVLLPLLAGEQVSFAGDLVRSSTFGPLQTPGAAAPPVLLAALGPRMLALAGRRAAGTVTWMTGPATVSDHIVPTIHKAAEAAGRPTPEVVVLLPVCVTAAPEAARERAASLFAVYGTRPSYQAMLAREGAAGPADVAIVGSEEEVAAAIGAIAEAGATEFGAFVFGSREERARTTSLVASLASR
jgi:5,10-methylenetetrahydromethanopterin reductase